MIRKFLKDTRGSYAILTVAAMVPIMGALALAIDYAEVSRQREVVRNALDAAGMAVARRILDGKPGEQPTDDQLKAYATDFFNNNLGSVKPANAPLKVTLPNAEFGGGTLEMESTLKYEPYFLPAAAALIGKSSSDIDLNFVVRSGIRLKNTLEVALVLDNSGSMSYLGSGTGQKRIDLLKNASKQLVDTLAMQALQMKQIDKPVQFGLVPFAASVNVSPTNANQSWMDVDGISPVHHENFDWSTLNASNKYAEKTGDVWYKRGNGWGETEDTPLTRFSLYMDTEKVVAREFVETSREWVCVKKKNGKCQTYDWKIEGYNVDIPGPFATWQGCVEARPAPYNNNDVTPSTSNAATLFVPMFATDEPGDNWATETDSTPDDRNAVNNWWNDGIEGSDTLTNNRSRQKNMTKYFDIRPFDADPPKKGNGPNYSCTTNPITPLRDVSKADEKQQIKAAIDEMTPSGNTNVPEGTAWGWRVVSSGAPFTEGRADGERGNDKVVIVLTDGANTYGDLGSADPAGNKSTYAAYGYTGKGYNGSGTSRIFMDTSSAVGKSTYTSENYQAAMDEQMQQVCTKAKGTSARNDQGEGNDSIIVMTVSLDLTEAKSDEKKAIAALKNCASYSRTTVGKKLYWNATGDTLMQVFKEIADELSNLRIVS
ncbi:pilus assembly protein TadG-related protein [Aminobacter sp. P9b]|uniref:Flp pilus assembly protein TadG n=1 Tax=Aminobacter niigataensis TaxID=83265 RepID=A0ABR6KZT6_9HYPH|nr:MULTISPECIES: pilus assembly protein TadG-related protein [Aminobacter]AWC24639.1 Flp pilus assembly protein TadG [Aminobacter sp. MSH1]MBB4650049.1 Flp pilus assembly protein TadG [Aminobacter niigataensis]CAI2935422.1 Flp pilus assembly protein TadG [Aminobacter niigataensis]